MFTAKENIILASASPRRHAYLKELGLDFEVFTTDIDETPKYGEDPLDYAARMVRDKGEAVMQKYPESWVIAADTVVFLQKNILGKPQSCEDAIRTLMLLRGREHQVATAFGVGCVSKNIFHEETVVTRVKFSFFSEETARAYAATGEPTDKAGAYGIQGMGAIFVEELQGSCSNVVGLPLCQLIETLYKYGIVETQ